MDYSVGLVFGADGVLSDKLTMSKLMADNANRRMIHMADM